ncbi:thiamine diphosphokinase [Mucilaginibacter sp. SP1R1]|uniref:thiamine diphosphokinase n=1 Tax=Mucilaginibacter sp. SP1R1 TaxID=2723091 RepID=UPI001622D5FE|nr:thiamine diphosphokinase [Mucilaginibacter sp. SP1R1]MBB6147871.1 thiamine pyrophosphokinase [Mucilaginibacter sp. SP1R1]
MSSHHIVREKQEPALLVLGIDSFPEELLGQLLEWSPTVITTPHTAEKLDASGIKVDWMITDGDHGIIQSDVKVMSAGDATMAAAAFNYLIANHYPAVNVVTDELDLNVFLQYAGKINLVIFHDQQKIYAVNSGFSKWKPANEIIKLLTEPDGLKYTGLERIGEGEYKTTGDGFFTLQFKDAFLFVAEAVD